MATVVVVVVGCRYPLHCCNYFAFPDNDAAAGAAALDVRLLVDDDRMTRTDEMWANGIEFAVVAERAAYERRPATSVPSE